MHLLLSLLQWICLIPVIGGSVYSILCVLAVRRFVAPSSSEKHFFSRWPPVTILKPICGLEKNQKVGLRSACIQDYPEYQVVYSVQDPHDPAVPLLEEIQQEFGSDRVSIVVDDRQVGPNKKINNLLGALAYARHHILVVCDSDVRLRPDYLKAIVAPLSDPGVGCVCTLYKATCADRWFEKMELLTLNADFIPSLIFAQITGASQFCLGSSLALRRSSLEEMGGLESLADYLVEDYEFGRRLWVSGKKVSIVPYFVEIVVNLKDPSEWWHHQVLWDQKTCAARPKGFFATVITRSIPFAFLFAASRAGDPAGLTVLGVALAVRLATAGMILRRGIRDTEGVRYLSLLPLRDLAALVSWFLALTKKTVIWRGTEFILTRKGRLIRLRRRPRLRAGTSGENDCSA